MHKKIAFGLLVATCASATALAQEPEVRVLTLADVEELVAANNPLVRGARAEVDVAEARRAQAGHARFLPTFSLTNVWGLLPRVRGEFTSDGVLVSPDTSTGLSDLRPFTQVDLEIIQPLWTFGRLAGINDAAAAEVLAATANVAAQTDIATRQARELYWGVVLGGESVRLVEDVIANARRADSVLQAKFDEGSEDVTQNDVFKFRIFEYEINKRHREALDKLALARSTLAAAIGLDDPTGFELAAQYLEPLDVALDSLPAYLELAMDNRPEVEQLNAGMHATRSLVRASVSEYLPQLFAGGQISYNYAMDRFDPRNPFVNNQTNFFRPGVALGLRWNLNFAQTRDKARVARSRYHQLEERRPGLLAGVRLAVEQAFREANRAARDMTGSRQALRASENWLRSETQTFDLGLSEVKDLIDAFRANSAMRAEHLQNIFEFNAAVAALSQAVGADLHPDRAAPL
jgi:outer membrane protein TolC